MSKRLDPETEELLWAAAESDDPAVVDEFERRFPDLRPELATRRVMVEVLRKSKPDAAAGAKETFKPTPTARAVFAQRVVWVPAMAVALAVLAFGAYQATLYFVQEKPVSSQDGNVDGTNRGAPPPAPVITGDGADTSQGVPVDDGSRDPVTGRPLGVGDRPPTPREPEKLVELPGETTLFAAFDQFVKQTGIRVQLMPGVVDAPIRLFLGDSNQSIFLPPGEAVQAIARAGRVRILQNGPEEYLVFPPENTESRSGTEGANQ